MLSLNILNAPYSLVIMQSTKFLARGKSKSILELKLRFGQEAIG